MVDEPSLGFEPAALPPLQPESRVVNFIIYVQGQICTAVIDRLDQTERKRGTFCFTLLLTKPHYLLILAKQALN
jgi:hypothetical protein